MGPHAEEFGPYIVYEQLGLGGMATVHRAETQGIAGFSKQVALKRMLPSVAADASLVKSFIREARLASHLRHANVAQTYDLGKVGETYFIAMELIPGRNLREILKHCAAVVGNMPLPVALNIINQICDALDYAHNLCDESGHSLGIIHRDVSPSNIIVSEGGVVKLIDFGIAKASARSGMQTQTGTLKGKFSYMAPEYLMGSIDARADLFALGVIAHELLANRPLFQGKDDMDTLYRVKDMPILPPSQINPLVPPELDAVVMTALERNPDQRWQRANALRQALTTEIKRCNLVAHNGQVLEWIDKAFEQTHKRSQFDVDSEPLISISSGTAELPRSAAVAALAGGTPQREVPDEFSNPDGHATLIKPSTSRPYAAPEPAWKQQKDAASTRKLPGTAPPNEWNVVTDVTTPESHAMGRDRSSGETGAGSDWHGGTDVPTGLLRSGTDSNADPTALLRKSAPQQAVDPTTLLRKSTQRPAVDPNLVDTRRPPARSSSPHVIPRRNTPVPMPRNTPVPHAQASLDEDDIRTLPPQSVRNGLDDDDQMRTLPPRSSRNPLDDDDQMRTLPPRSSRNSLDDDDQMRTLPPRSERPSTPPGRPSAPAMRAERPSSPPGRPSDPAMRAQRPSAPPPRPSDPAMRAERPSQPPALAPKSDAQARTIMIDTGAPAPAQTNQPMPLGMPERAERPSQAPIFPADPPNRATPPSSPPTNRATPPSSPPANRAAPSSSSPPTNRAAPSSSSPLANRATPNPSSPAAFPGLASPSSPPAVRTLPGTGAPNASASPAALAAQAAMQSPAVSGARTAPRMHATDHADQDQARHAKAVLDDLATRGERPSAARLLGTPQGSVVKTRVEPQPRGASNFLLTVLVLIAAGGAAAVVYFALPYLT